MKSFPAICMEVMGNEQMLIDCDDEVTSYGKYTFYQILTEDHYIDLFNMLQNK